MKSEEPLNNWVTRANAGDFVAMAYVAILHYLQEGSSNSSNNWIRRAMASDDAEFLISLGEELVVGAAIGRDLRLAEDCFRRAMTVSDLMGSYAMARFTIGLDRNRGLEYLERAAAAEHIPSRHLLNSLRLPNKGLRRRLASFRYLPRLIRETQNVLHGRAVKQQWWRYKDVFLEMDAEVKIALGEDRRTYFPCSRPSPISVFSEVCKTGHSAKLAWGNIDLKALLESA